MSLLDSLFGFILSPIEATEDSLGMSQHGRDQYISQANQRELLAIQNRYNQENFDRQFAAENQEFDRRYNQYQSPQALVRLYSEAGLNSSAVLGSGQSGFGQIGAAVNPSPVSVPSSSSPSPMQISQKSASDTIDALSRMKLNEAQKDEIYELLKGKLREQEDTHKWQSVLTAQKAFEFELDKKYGDNKRAQEIANLAQEGLVLYMQGQESAANAKFLKAKEMLAEDEHKFNDIKYPKYGLYLDAMIQAIRAQAVESSAKAGEASANAAVLREEKRIRSVAADIKEGASANELKSVIDDLIAKSAISEEQYAKALVEIMKIDKIREMYNKHDSKLKVDATIENCLRIIGLNLGISAHN